jgi:hypothetical protein
LFKSTEFQAKLRNGRRHILLSHEYSFRRGSAVPENKSDIILAVATLSAALLRVPAKPVNRYVLCGFHKTILPNGIDCVKQYYFTAAEILNCTQNKILV